MYELPSTVECAGKIFHIRNKGDYRVILDVMSALQDEEIDERARAISSLLIFYEDFTEINDLQIDQSVIQCLLEGMMAFIACGETDNPGKPSPKLIDWEQDESMICSAINKVAGTEIRAVPYCHWWTFIGYYMSIGESTLSFVVSIRSKIQKGTKLEKYEQEFRRENPQYFTWKKDKAEADEFLEELLKNW